MNEFQRAAEALKKEATRTQAILEAADTISKIGSLKQAAAEAEARIAKLRSEEGGLQKRATAAKEAERAALKGAEAAKVEAAEEAERIRSDARAKAAKHVADAKQKADVAVAGANAKLRELDKETAAAEKRRDAALSQAQNAEKQLAEIRRQREALRAALG